MAQSGHAERLLVLLGARVQQSVLDKPARLPQPQPLSPARAAANAVGRAAERLYRMPVLPLDFRPGAATLAELPELLPEGSLLIVLQGPGDLIGAISLSYETVTALIEVQALGRVTARHADRRRLTRSDAAICVDFINALMTNLSTEMAGVEGFGPIPVYRYATFLEEARPLLLMLEDRPYRSLSLSLRFGDGADTRDGAILIALPHKAEARGAEARGTETRAPEARSTTPALPAAGPSGTTLAPAMADAPVEVVGVLCRRTVSLGELRALTPGKLLPLPRVNLSEARLETPDGQLLAIGKLGESEGCHALRLHDPAESSARPTAPALSPAAVASTPDLLATGLSGVDPFRAAPGPESSGDTPVARFATGA